MTSIDEIPEAIGPFRLGWLGVLGVLLFGPYRVSRACARVRAGAPAKGSKTNTPNTPFPPSLRGLSETRRNQRQRVPGLSVDGGDGGNGGNDLAPSRARAHAHAHAREAPVPVRNEPTDPTITTTAWSGFSAADQSRLGRLDHGGVVTIRGPSPRECRATNPRGISSPRESGSRKSRELGAMRVKEDQ